MTAVIKPSEEQAAIIEYGGNLVAMARPGSGKTFVMSEKVRRILNDLPDYRGAIAISYTNKASGELKRRASSNGVSLKSSFFGTIDKFCLNEIIFPFLPHLWGRPSVELKIQRFRDLPEKEREQFATIKPYSVSLDILTAHLAAVTSYFRAGALFLDMTGALAVYAIQNSGACRNYIKAKYTHVFIDEYQDAGLEQHALFLELAKLGLVATAVGDADQSIFGFSGKDSRYLTDLAGNEAFKAFPITFNHRCHPSIVNYSLRLFSKDSVLLKTNVTNVYDVTVVGGPAEICTWIDKNLPTLCGKFDVKNLSDVGILVRSKHAGEFINSNLTTKHRFVVPHPLEEHFSLWSTLFALLLGYYHNEKLTAQGIIDECSSAMLAPKEIVSCRKQIKAIRGPALPGADRFIDIAKAIYPAAESAESIKLLQDTLANEESLKSFHEPESDEVQIMTLHKSKGLEFDIVFHLELYEYVLPIKGPGPDNDWKNPVYPSWDQDLNLHYVGVTRARKCCVLVLSSKRLNGSGEEKKGKPSDFLAIHDLDKLRRPIAAIL